MDRSTLFAREHRVAFFFFLPCHLWNNSFQLQVNYSVWQWSNKCTFLTCLIVKKSTSLIVTSLHFGVSVIVWLKIEMGLGFFLSLSLSLRHVRSKAAWGRWRWQSEYFAQLVNSSMWPHLFLTLISYSPAGRASSSWTPWKCSSMNMLASFYESERVYLHLQECMHPECIEKCSECFTLSTF